jgi:glycosyltransferase involved in cell wall biosynthesis
MDADKQPPPANDPSPSRRVLLLGAGPLPSPRSPAAPGVANRLWHFLQPAIAAGHHCLALTLEPDAPELGGRRPEAKLWRDLPWQHLALGVADFKRPDLLAGVVASFDPQIVVAAGTLQAGATACALAGDRPVWVDLFGDPLAEIQTKAGLLGDAFDLDEHLFVWELMLRVLTRADAFSTVSRRQRDALLGQLLLLGMTDAQVEQMRNAEGGTRKETEEELQSNPRDAGIVDLIHPMPCAVERLELLPRPSPAERAALLESAGLPPDSLVALWSGGFNAWADPLTLVAGLELAMRREPRLRLVATGGPLPGYLSRVYETMRAATAASRHVARFHLLDWLPLETAQRWAAAADVGLMVDRPCAETQLGARNRLLTFVAAHCPVVATRGTEVVDEMELTAGALLACDPGRPDALAEAVFTLLANPALAHAVADRAVDHVRRAYTFAASCGPFLEFVARAEAVTAPDDAAPPASAAEWIAGYIDPVRRRADWAELVRYRSGRWNRLRDWLGRKPR